MEARDGLPFRGYAPSGSVLERTLRRLGLARDDFFLTNILRCRPWGNVLDGASYEHEAITACEPNLLEVLRRFRPKVLIALGNVPTRSLTGLAGEKRTVSHLRGYVLRALPQFEQAAGRSADDPLLVVPSFHPAFLRRGAIHLTGVLARDIARAVNVRQGRDTSFILDLPDLTFRSADCPYDPVDNPDPWDQNYADWEQRRKREIQEGLASWQARHGLRYNCYPTRREVDLFCRDVKARSDAWLALSPDARRASHLALSYDLETVESTSLDEDATDGFTDTVIRMSQFSIERGQGLALDWHAEHIQAARWLWKLPLPKCGHNNWLFDDRVLRAVGQRDFGDSAYLLPSGDLHDTLQQFHFHWSDLPAHLQFAASFIQFPFPWKHYNESCTEFYGIADTDACLGIYQMSRKTMEDRGVWWDGMAGRESSGYVAQVEQVRPILAAMEDRGLPINDLKRMGLGEEFDAAERELQEELDERFPDTARRIKTYKTVPPEAAELLERSRPADLPPANAVNEKGKPLGKGARAKLERTARLARYASLNQADLDLLHATVFWEVSTKDKEKAEKKKEEGARLAQLRREQRDLAAASDGVSDPDADEEVGADGDGESADAAHIGKAYRYALRSIAPVTAAGEDSADPLAEFTPVGPFWCRVYSFSPNSAKQLFAYMTARRHPIPFDRKQNRNTTAKREILRLGDRFKDDFYAKVIECREVRKMRSTYIDGFRPQADGRAHPTFTFATATQQLSARSPNSQNYPSRSRLAKAIKGMIEAPEGMELANWDLKSYHVLITGFLAEDPSYMRLARMDMHSFVAWHFLRLPGANGLLTLPDEELAEKLTWFKGNKEHPEYKQTRDNQAKPSILGIALGLMPQHLYEMNREHFESVRQSKQFRELIEHLFPKVFAWQRAVCEEAHQRQVLFNRFGASRWFYEVYAPDGKGGMKPGDQFNAAMAFRVQSEAHGALREKFKRLRVEGMDTRFGLCNTIHDSATFCYRKELRGEMLTGVGRILAEPSKVLVHPTLAPNGLTVGVECAIGPNMAELEEVKL
jgi:uracil-DNA glycosylase family 4